MNSKIVHLVGFTIEGW